MCFFSTPFQKVEYLISSKNVNCVQFSLAQSSVFYFHWAQRSKIPIKSGQNHENGTQDPTDQSYRLKADPLYSSKVQRHSLQLGPQGSGSSRRSRDGLIVRGGEHQQSCHQKSGRGPQLSRNTSICRHLPIRERAWPPAFPQYQHLLASADKSNTSNPSTSFLNTSQTRFRPPTGPKYQKSKTNQNTSVKMGPLPPPLTPIALRRALCIVLRLSAIRWSLVLKAALAAAGAAEMDQSFEVGSTSNPGICR